MSRVVVFGATGRTGAEIVEQALGRGHHVTAAARRLENLSELTKRWSGTGRLRAARADLRDAASTRAAVTGAEVVISSIAPAGRDPDGLFSLAARWMMSRRDLAEFTVDRSTRQTGSAASQHRHIERGAFLGPSVGRASLVADSSSTVENPGPPKSVGLIGVTGMGHIVFVDVGYMIGVDSFVFAWTFVASFVLDRIRGVTRHRHLHGLLIHPPSSSHRDVCRYVGAPDALRRTGKNVRIQSNP